MAGVGAVPGFAELFLKPGEKETFSRWEEIVEDSNQMKQKATEGFLNGITDIIPDNIAPNLISFAGIAVLAQCWYVLSHYGSYYPTSCTWLSVISILLYATVNGLHARQSERIRQKNSLNDLLNYSTGCFATVFLTLITTYCLGVDTWQTQWYAVQTSQLILFIKHMTAFRRGAGMRYVMLFGPGEVMSLMVILLAVRATFGLAWLIDLYGLTIHRLVVFLAPFNVTLPSIAGDVQLTGAEVIKTTYYVAYTAAIFECLVLPKELSWSRFGTLTSLLLRLGPALLHGLGLPNYEQSIADVMCDGFFMSVLTTDITLAKMAGREIHPWVVLMGFASSFSYSVTFTLTAVYYIAVFGDLCHYMNLPLLTVCRNVYCDGVYDLCHIGHKNLFKRALTYGNRLFVGVVGDADASNYKRPPIMSHDERCAEVAGCKHVTKVIQNSPCFGLTQEFIDLHQIHVVAFGQEYLERWPDPKDDIYYGYARQIGIAKPMPRTQGLSTSDLIRRIQAARPADEKKSPT